MDIEKLLNDLNSFSRMAVIENAPLTEKIINKYILILKYKYQKRTDPVIAEKELQVAKAIFEFGALKYGNISGEINNQIDLKSILIPHYVIAGYLESLLDFSTRQKWQVHFVVTVEQRANEVVFRVELQQKNSKSSSTMYDTSMDLCNMQQTFITDWNDHGEEFLAVADQCGCEFKVRAGTASIG